MLCSNSVWCCYIAYLCFVLEDSIHQIVFLDAVTRVDEEPGRGGDYVIENFVLSEGLKVVAMQSCCNANSQLNMLCSNSVWRCYITNLGFVLEDSIHQIVF